MPFKIWEDLCKLTEFYLSHLSKTLIDQSVVTLQTNSSQEFLKIWILCHQVIKYLNWSLESTLIKETQKKSTISNSALMLIDQKICSPDINQREPLETQPNLINQRPQLLQEVSSKDLLEKLMSLKIDSHNKLSILQTTPQMLKTD